MGQDIDFEVDLGEVDFLAGTTLLICSDGITNMVDENEIKNYIDNCEPYDLVKQLIDLANQNGGVDNSTAVCIRAL